MNASFHRKVILFTTATLLSVMTLIHQAEAKPQKKVLRKFRICTATLSDPELRKAFQKRLKNLPVEYFELTKFEPLPNQSVDSGEKVETVWFKRACHSGLQCDALVISGHLAKDIFSKHSKNYLPLDEAESFACEEKCDGLLKAPQEVFIIGNNTTSAPRSEAPADYLAALSKEGAVRSDAEEIVQTKSGPFSANYRERLYRVFKDVPEVHGFDHVGSDSAGIEAQLNRLLGTTPYTTRLAQLETARVAQEMKRVELEVQRMNDPIHPAEKIEAPTSELRERSAAICKLQNRRFSLLESLEQIRFMILSRDRELYLPSVTDWFIQNHVALKKLPDDSKILFEALGRDSRSKKLFADAAAQSVKDPYELSRILRAQLLLGMKNQKQVDDEMKLALKENLKKLNRNNVDLLFKVVGVDDLIHLDVTIEDLDPTQLTNAMGTIALQALRTKDSRITARVLAVFNSAIAPEYLSAALGTLQYLPGYDREIVQISQPYFEKALEPVAAQAFANILKHSTGDQILPNIREAIVRDKTGLMLYRVFEYLETSKTQSDGLVSDFLRKIPSMNSLQKPFVIPAMVMSAPPDTRVWDREKKELEALSAENKEQLFQVFAYEKKIPSTIVDLALSYADEKDDRNLVAIFAKATLNEEQRDRLFSLAKSKSDKPIGDFYKTVLRRQPSDWVEEKKSDLEGAEKNWVCSKETGRYECNDQTSERNTERVTE